MSGGAAGTDLPRAADLVARRLYAAGCRLAFGMPGGEVLTLVDALERAGIATTPPAARRIGLPWPWRCC